MDLPFFSDEKERPARKRMTRTAHGLGGPGGGGGDGLAVGGQHEVHPLGEDVLVGACAQIATAPAL